jgi:ribosomal protein S18 acetylase RimI-like enzyme
MTTATECQGHGQHHGTQNRPPHHGVSLPATPRRCLLERSRRQRSIGRGYLGSIGTVEQSTVMQFLIRDAELTDMDDLQGVFRRASLSNENDRGLLQEHPEWLVLSDDGVLDGRVRVAVDDDDTVVGFATYLIADGLAELVDLFVDPPSMRKGVASSLVRDIAARLNRLHFATLEVTANPHAMAFYEHLGFVETRVVDTAGYPASRMSRPTRSTD